MRAIEWVERASGGHQGTVRFIDQTKLPNEEKYVETDDVELLGESIRALRIRGAPAIGIAAGFGLVLAAQNARTMSELRAAFDRASDLLAATRPTAVNLFWSLRRMRSVFENNSSSSSEIVQRALLSEANRMLREDEETCRMIGRHGAALVPQQASILTHCNTGALATGGDGTAQSVITASVSEGKRIRVYIGETRPLLQGARLTCWELVRAGVDVTLITDSTAAFLLKQRKVDLILVGADRIALNGDVANKIGTYNLAVLAEKHRIPLYVAAPTSTIDFDLNSGEAIPIEERDPREVTEIFGTKIAPEGVRVYSPAFDITPHELITAIITEAGILMSPFTDSIPRSGIKTFTKGSGPLKARLP